MADQAFIGVEMGVGRDFCNAKVEYMWKNTLWKKNFHCHTKTRIVNVLKIENEDV